MNNGGPAFSGSYEWGEEEEFTGYYEGMTLLDYFAAHAPAEPQLWFEPVMETKCPERIYPNGKIEGLVGSVNYKEIEAWCRERDKQRHIQWPYAWAREMLKQKEKET